jgi:hypothetical protein
VSAVKECGVKVQGQCHCGAIRFEAEADPERVSICHCTDCQSLTGTAYRVSVKGLLDTLKHLGAEPAVYVKTADSGARRAQVFCPTCGSPLYTYDADQPRGYGLRVGCLAQRRDLVPTKRLWCRSALPWSQDLRGLAQREQE